jgi:hypothetical protein
VSRIDVLAPVKMLCGLQRGEVAIAA